MKQASVLSRQPCPEDLYASEHALLRSKDIRRLLGNVSRSTLYRMLKKGEFPLPSGWCNGSRFWLIEQYHQWLKNKTH